MIPGSSQVIRDQLPNKFEKELEFSRGMWGDVGETKWKGPTEPYGTGIAPPAQPWTGSIPRGGRTSNPSNPRTRLEKQGGSGESRSCLRQFPQEQFPPNPQKQNTWGGPRSQNPGFHVGIQGPLGSTLNQIQWGPQKSDWP